ncbi:MAG: winged helix-turn-helix domain-containing protein [Ardenticatenia bacterium]|nr:winged helix-turn-helix domain-containing protein [Ardenticatenia bacterium]
MLSIGLAYRLTFVDREGTVPVFFEPHSPPRLHVDEARREVRFGHRVLDPPLSPAQFELLRVLYRAGGHPVSREEIIEAVWGDEATEGVTDQALDALVHRLRRRLAEVVPGKELVATVRGHGFRLNMP